MDNSLLAVRDINHIYIVVERREKVLKRILHVLNIAAKQGERAKKTIIFMLNYEEDRQRILLEQRWIHRTISKKQKEEYEKSIQLYEEYVQLLIKRIED